MLLSPCPCATYMYPDKRHGLPARNGGGSQVTTAVKPSFNIDRAQAHPAIPNVGYT